MPRNGIAPLSADEMLAYLRAHVYKEGACLRWAGSFNATGYPKTHWQHKTYLAARLLLQLSGKLTNPKLVVYSTCGNRWCVSEKHLKVATREKAAEKTRKFRRYCTGIRRSILNVLHRQKKKNVKLPHSERFTVMRMRAEGATYKTIAEKYGVDPSAVGYAMKVWAKLYGPMPSINISGESDEPRVES